MTVGEVQRVAIYRALPSFRAVSSVIERGTYYRLSDPIVRQCPVYFAALVPVSELLGEIER